MTIGVSTSFAARDGEGHDPEWSSVAQGWWRQKRTRRVGAQSPVFAEVPRLATSSLRHRLAFLLVPKLLVAAYLFPPRAVYRNYECF